MTEEINKTDDYSKYFKTIVTTNSGESYEQKTGLPCNDSDDESLGEYTVKKDDIKQPKAKVNRNEYMKEYYAKNKVTIIGKICKKEQCEYCNRMVAHQQIMKHQKSQYCKTRRLHKLEMMNN